VTNPLGHGETAAYDEQLGVLTSVTDANGHNTSADYDEFGRMIALVQPGDSSVAPTVEAFGMCQ
jgi:YD repeat-containing protein